MSRYDDYDEYEEKYEEEYEQDNIYNCDADEQSAHGAEPSIWYN